MRGVLQIFRPCMRGVLQCFRGAGLSVAFSLLTLGPAFGTEWHGEGTILSLEPERKMIFLDHQAIPGCMPPMKMAFWVQSPKLLEGLAKGNRVRFSFKVEDPLIVIFAITKEED